MVRIPLHGRGDTIRGFALANDEDARDLSRYRWHLTADGYAARTVRRPGRSPAVVYMHRQLLGLTPGDGLQGDHRNRRRLDNRRSNLRIVTLAQNRQNSSGYRQRRSRYRGLRWHANRRKPWQVRIYCDGKSHSLGYYADEDEAGRVAAEFRRKHMPYSVEAA